MLSFKLLCLVLALVFVTVQSSPISAAHKRCARKHNAALEAATTTTAQAQATGTPKELVAEDSTNESEGEEDTETNDKPKDNKPKDDKKPDNEDNSDDDDKSDNGSSSSGDASSLFPIGRGKQSWTTVDGSTPLSNGAIRPFKDMKALSHDITSAPDGQKGMLAFYPKGSMNPGNSPKGGFSFYAPGPKDVDITSAKEVTFGYSVYFDKGFDWVKGGKLPGVYGGNSADGATSCSGGRRDDGCFSSRLMWRAGGAGELYTYLPPSFSENKRVCDAPNSHCNSVYGASVGRGSVNFKSGQWNTIAERVRLNDAGKSNGEIELYSDGKSVVKVTGLVLRDGGAGKFRGMQMQTFFGGSHDGFQATKDSKVWFKDFSMAITKTL